MLRRIFSQTLMKRTALMQLTSFLFMLFMLALHVHPMDFTRHRVDVRPPPTPGEHAHEHGVADCPLLHYYTQPVHAVHWTSINPHLRTRDGIVLLSHRAPIQATPCHLPPLRAPPSIEA